MTVMACQVAKGVYTERPASHNIVEGRRMIRAARKYERIVQLGTRRHGSDYVKEAVDYARSGEIGHVGLAPSEADHRHPRPSHDTAPGIDYALWQEPVLDRPLIMNRFYYNWHWF